MLKIQDKKYFYRFFSNKSITNHINHHAGIFTYDDNYELFENYKVLDQVKKINEIKNNFDFLINKFR